MPEDFGALRVVDLKEECKKRNLTVGGKKAELISRLEEFEASKDDAGAATVEKPTNASEQESALPAGAPEDAEAAAEEIINADEPSAQNDGKAAADPKQSDSTPADEQAPDAEIHKTRSKGEVASVDADATAQEVFAEAEAAGKAEAQNETENVGNDAAGSKSAKQPQPQSQSGTASSQKASAAAATDNRPATETPAPAEDDAAAATKVPTAAAGANAADAQQDALKPTQLAPSGADAMDIDSEPPSGTPSEASNKQAKATPAAHKKSHAAADKAADSATAAPAADKTADKAAEKADAVPLVAALTDAGMGDAATGEDAEMVQYDAQSDDEQVAPAKKQAEVKTTKDDKAQRRDPPSASKAPRHEATPHASARKRGREADESASRDVRKAPRTERRSDVKLSQREKDKEREREKDKEREREKDKDRAKEKDSAKDSKQTNGDPPSDRRRKHAPISYKPPERTGSQTDKPRAGTDTTRRDARTDRRPSDAEGAQELATRKSDLDRTVSRTESGHKLSVFERLQRGKGEGGSGSGRAPSTGRDPIPTPAAAKPKEALPRTSSHSRRTQPTQALRIDGFVRPLTVQKTQAMLSEFGEIQKLWMPSIRTHAFVVFASAEQAEKCFKATSGLNWPQGNLGSTLAPKYVTVEEAELAIARAGGGPAPVGASASVTNGSAAGLPSAALDAAPAAVHAHERRAVAEERRRGPDDRRRGPHDDATDRGRVTGNAGPQAVEAAAEAAAAPQVDNPPTLDELFRKTTTKPCLYWLPLTDSQAAERKATLEAAAASKKAEVADVAVPLTVA